MKLHHVFLALTVTVAVSTIGTAQSTEKQSKSAKKVKHLYIDVHRLEPGKVEFKDVAAAHAKGILRWKRNMVSTLSNIG